VNNTIPSITSAILDHMQSLSSNFIFFKVLVHNENWELIICHRVRLVAEAHEDLLDLLSLVAPVCQNPSMRARFDAKCPNLGLVTSQTSDLRTFWSDLITTATQDYGFAFLATSSGFQCRE
jgi:hypothetical protein